MDENQIDQQQSNYNQSATNQQQENHNYQPNMNQQANYNYQPEGYGVPEQVKGWNWGAFALPVFWGIGNKVYIPLLVLLCVIPHIGWIIAIAVPIVCGIKGNEWAWKNGNYTDVNTFETVQSTWKRAGLVAFILEILGGIIAFLAIIVIGVSFVDALGGYYY